MLRKCKQCGKPLKKDKIMYGAFYCGERCKSEFRKGSAKIIKQKVHKRYL